MAIRLLSTQPCLRLPSPPCLRCAGAVRPPSRGLSASVALGTPPALRTRVALGLAQAIHKHVVIRIVGVTCSFASYLGFAESARGSMLVVSARARLCTLPFLGMCSRLPA